MLQHIILMLTNIDFLKKCYGIKVCKSMETHLILLEEENILN